jgi:hypothetical protein
VLIGAVTTINPTTGGKSEARAAAHKNYGVKHLHSILNKSLTDNVTHRASDKAPEPSKCPRQRLEREQEAAAVVTGRIRGLSTQPY